MRSRAVGSVAQGIRCQAVVVGKGPGEYHEHLVSVEELVTAKTTWRWSRALAQGPLYTLEALERRLLPALAP